MDPSVESTVWDDTSQFRDKVMSSEAPARSINDPFHSVSRKLLTGHSHIVPAPGRDERRRLSDGRTSPSRAAAIS